MTKKQLTLKRFFSTAKSECKVFFCETDVIPCAKIEGKTSMFSIMMAEDYDDDEKKSLNLLCVACNNPLSYTKKHKRRLNGVLVPVRAYFSHRRVEGTQPCMFTAESYIHKAAKQLIMQHKPVFYIKCASCTKTFDVDVYGGQSTLIDDKKNLSSPSKNAVFKLVEEYTRTNLQTNLHTPECFYRFDVACVLPSDEVCGVIEVCYSHPVSETKASYLTDSNIAWVEVDAKNVIQTVHNNQSNYVRVQALRYAYGVECVECIQHKTFQREECLSLQSQVQRLEEEVRKKKRQLEAEVIKYKLTVDELLQQDQNMYKFLLDQEACRIQSILVWHNKYLSTRPPSICLPFGKYMGLRIDAIFEVDKRYVRWLAKYNGYLDCDNKPMINTTKSLLWTTADITLEARRLLKGFCICCFAKVSKEWQHLCKNCFQKI